MNDYAVTTQREAYFVFTRTHPDCFRAGRYRFRFRYVEAEQENWSLFLEKNTVPVKCVLLTTAPTKEILGHWLYNEGFSVLTHTEAYAACEWLVQHRMLQRLRRPKAR